MNKSPERAKDTGNFLLFRPCRGSCYDDCPTPGCARSYLSNGLSGLPSKSRDPKVTRTPDYTQSGAEIAMQNNSGCVCAGAAYGDIVPIAGAGSTCKVRCRAALAEACAASEGPGSRAHHAQAFLRNSRERGRLGRKKAGATPALP